LGNFSFINILIQKLGHPKSTRTLPKQAESNFRLATKRSNPEIFPFSTRKGKSTFCYRISPTLGWYFDATMEEGGPWNFDFGPGIEIEFKRM
jgi:hypothetical protein